MNHDNRERSMVLYTGDEQILVILTSGEQHQFHPGAEPRAVSRADADLFDELQDFELYPEQSDEH